VAIASMGTEADLAERVALRRGEVRRRVDDIELQFGFFQVSMDEPTPVGYYGCSNRRPGGGATQTDACSTVPVVAARGDIQRCPQRLGGRGISYFSFSNTGRMRNLREADQAPARSLRRPAVLRLVHGAQLCLFFLTQTSLRACSPDGRAAPSENIGQAMWPIRRSV